MDSASAWHPYLAILGAVVGYMGRATLTVFVAEFEHEMATGRQLPGLLVFRRVYILVEFSREDPTVDSLYK